MMDREAAIDGIFWLHNGDQQPATQPSRRKLLHFFQEDMYCTG